MESPSLHFAATVRTISAAARARGLTVPGFRSPPRRPGMERTIRRTAEGAATVSVAEPRQMVAARRANASVEAIDAIAASEAAR